MVSVGPRAQPAGALSILFNSVNFIHVPLEGAVHAENFKSLLMFLALIET